MGGGGAFRAAAKVAGAAAANSGFRSVTAEHSVYAAAARNVARPVSISGLSSTSEDVKPGMVMASHGGSSGVSYVPKMVSDFDDWEMAGGEEEMMVNHGEPLPRLVFGGAPSLQEATEATSDLKDALVYLSGSANGIGGSCISSSGSSSSPVSKACVVSETIVTKSVPKHALQAYRVLSEIPAAQNVVASIACDPNVWNAVLQNPALQDFLESQRSSEKCASFPDSNQERDESVTNTDTNTHSFSESSPLKAIPESKAEESKSGNSFTSFLQNVTQTVTQTVVDMMDSLSDFFSNLFGGNKFFVDADGTAKFGAVEKTLGASFMALAVMVMMVVVSKRNH